MYEQFKSGGLVDVLRIRAEEECFKRWQRPGMYEGFIEYVWLHTDWTKHFYSGVLHGAVVMRSLNAMMTNPDQLGEYQCLQYNSCLINELRGNNG